MMDVENSPELWSDAVLTRSYDDNQTKYGSFPNHTRVVNEEFRPPPEDLEDLLAISRTRRPTVWGRINPGGGYTKAQNTSLNNVDGWLKDDDRATVGSIEPTFESHITFFEAPEQLDLTKVLPSYSVSAGTKHSPRNEIQPPMNIELNDNHPSIPVHSGFKPPFGAGTPLQVKDMELQRKYPEYSVYSGEIPISVFTPHELPIAEYTLPRTEGLSAGHRGIALGFETLEYSLDERPAIPVHSGFETGIRTNENLEAQREVARKTRNTPRNLPVHRAESGYRFAYSEAPTERRVTELKGTTVKPGPYQIPGRTPGLGSPQEAQGVYKAYPGARPERATAAETSRMGTGTSRLTERFEPARPVFHTKSDAMRPGRKAVHTF